MKVSKRTLEVLKNFAVINQGLLFKEGHIQKTMSVARNIFAECYVPDKFPVEFAIYDLNEFLSTLSLFNDPDLEFKDKYFLIRTDDVVAKYFYSNPNVVCSPPDKTIEMPKIKISYVLKREDLEKIQRASSVMKVRSLLMKSDCLSLIDKQNKDSGNQYKITLPIEVLDGDESFSLSLKVDAMKFIPSDYTVTATSNVAKFVSSCKTLTYYIALDVES